MAINQAYVTTASVTKKEKGLKHWNQKGNKLEITACKAHEGLVWKRFLKDEEVQDGEEVMDPTMVEKIHEQVIKSASIFRITRVDSIHTHVCL